MEVVVSQGDTGAEIGRTLLDAGVVASVEAFMAAANVDPDFTRVQPGTYTLPQQLPAVDAVAALLDPANRSNETVVIAEGLRVEQILQRLSAERPASRSRSCRPPSTPRSSRQVPGSCRGW